LPLSIFVTNKNGFPVLSNIHQNYLKHLFCYHIGVIFEDDDKTLYDNDTQKISIEKIKDYFIYIAQHIFTKHKEFVGFDYLLHSYLDVYQFPLQPLRDNLQSQTYECFEEDQTKYEYYEMAVYKALINYKETGFLRKDKIGSDNSIIDKNRKLVACILGGGRGPLVKRVFNAAKMSGIDLTIICVEKNKFAFNTLLALKIKEPEVFGNVITIQSDMRDYKPDTKLDIIVSELLGSFGDNELSPECLYNIQTYLSEDSIMVPHSYTSFIRPISCPVVWANVNIY
jgi:protein arginine N-methyltransferase 5